jgi:hypothetical protein
LFTIDALFFETRNKIKSLDLWRRRKEMYTFYFNAKNVKAYKVVERLKRVEICIENKKKHVAIKNVGE